MDDNTAFVLLSVSFICFLMFVGWVDKEDRQAKLAECISLSAVVLKTGEGEYCFDRGDKRYCMRRVR